MRKILNRADGIGMVELMCSFALLSIIGATLIPNFNELRTRAYDSRVKAEMANLFAAMTVESAEENATTYFYQTVRGPRRFNPPYNIIAVSDGITMTAYRRSFQYRRYTYDLIYQIGWHKHSKYRYLRYRYTINGKTYDYNYRWAT